MSFAEVTDCIASLFQHTIFPSLRQLHKLSYPLDFESYTPVHTSTHTPPYRNTLIIHPTSLHKMASFSVPSYLLPIYPNYYFDRRRGQYVQLVPEEVQRMYLQERSEIEQSKSSFPIAVRLKISQCADYCSGNAQQSAVGGGYLAAPFQGQAQPIVSKCFLTHVARRRNILTLAADSYGHINVGPFSFGSHQSGYSNHSFGSYYGGSQQQAPRVPQPSKKNLCVQPD